MDVQKNYDRKSAALNAFIKAEMVLSSLDYLKALEKVKREHPGFFSQLYPAGPGRMVQNGTKNRR